MSGTTPAEGAAQPDNAAPVFTEDESTIRSVAENTPAGENIGAPVAATDTDTGDTLTYSLGGTDAASFAIVAASGQLQTRAALDYETKTSHSVTVSVSDGNGGSDSIDVTINVTDVVEDDTVQPPAGGGGPVQPGGRRRSRPSPAPGETARPWPPQARTPRPTPVRRCRWMARGVRILTATR